MKTNPYYDPVLSATMVASTVPAANRYRVYFGTTATGEERGIYTALLDTTTGALSDPVRVSDSIRPGFIVIHPDGKQMYATEATGSFSGENSGFVSAYRIEADGTLTDLNTRSSGGVGPCYISMTPSGNQLLVANYHAGRCAILPILGNGELGDATDVRQHSGSGPHPERQKTAHTHSFNSDPDGEFALAADLGLDQILIYRMESGNLTPSDPPFTVTEPGGGPRHLTFDASGHFVYACMELNGTVSAYKYHGGKLTEIQTLPTLPEDFDGENTTSEVRLTPDGRFLYVGNRGHESLAIFNVTPTSGTLTALGHEFTRGKHPRHFNIDPSGTFLLVGNMHSNQVVVFRIDRETGQLEFTGNEIQIPSVSCIQFLP